MCTIGTVRHKPGAQSKSRREKLFSDVSQAPSAVSNKMANDSRLFTTPKVICPTNPPPPPCGDVVCRSQRASTRQHKKRLVSGTIGTFRLCSDKRLIELQSPSFASTS